MMVWIVQHSTRKAMGFEGCTLKSFISAPAKKHVQIKAFVRVVVGMGTKKRVR